MNLFGTICALGSILALGACADYDTRLNSRSISYLGGAGPSATSKEDSIAASKSYWDGDGVTGAPSIVVHIGEQTASFYKGDKLVGVSAISSGRDGYETPAGQYKIIQKKVDYRSNLYGNYVDAQGNILQKGVGIKIDPMPPGAIFEGAPMPYWMRLTTGGVGLHQGFLPGVPDSRGCIRLPEKMAKIYFENAPLGTPVTVVH
ncbi:MAG: hypothetical protein Fur0032_21360 [Terrimicrobiaceae bacterium]